MKELQELKSWAEAERLKAHEACERAYKNDETDSWNYWSGEHGAFNRIIQKAELLLGEKLNEDMSLHLKQCNVMRGHRPEPLPFEQFADVYVFAFGGVNEEWLYQRYTDWLKR